MVEIKNILCCVDFGPVTDKVIEYSKTICVQKQRKVYLVYVVHSLDFIEQFSVPQSYREEYESSIKGQAKKKMEELIKKHFPGDPGVESMILFGDPAKEIISMAEDKGADMIIIGSTAKKHARQFFFGSVGEKVIKMAKKAVLVVKP